MLGEEVKALAEHFAKSPTYHNAVVLQNRQRERAVAVSTLRRNFRIVR